MIILAPYEFHRPTLFTSDFPVLQDCDISWAISYIDNMSLQVGNHAESVVPFWVASSKLKNV